MDTNAETSPPGIFADATWSILELMGHRRKIGKVTQVEVFGAKMCRIEVVNIDGTFHTEFYGGSSIYACTPVSEAVARAEAARNASGQLPVEAWTAREILEKGRQEGEAAAERRLAPPSDAAAPGEEPTPERQRDERDEDDEEHF